MRLDHLAITAQTLEEGVTWAEERLGVPLHSGGKHARFGTHNMLLGLADGLYLEVIAVDPHAQSAGPRWFDLDRFSGPPRLANWICEPENFDDFLRHGMERVLMSRDDLHWEMGVPKDGSLPMDGGFPTVLRWKIDTPPGVLLAPSGCSLKTLTVYHPNASAIEIELSDVFQDARVTFESAGAVRLSASIETPTGLVTL